MSIPYYDDLYSFPGGYPWQSNGHRCHSEHGLQPSYAQETGKSIDIYDKFGHLRYNVTLSSQTFYDSRCYKTIVSQTLPEGLVAFLEVPGDSWQEDYHRALEDFRACVAKYQSLVNAEMRDFKDIKVYKDQIDYRVQNTRCCDTCKWCMKTFEGYDHPCWNYHWHKPNSKVLKRQCCSPENEQVFNYARQYPQMPHWHGKSSWQKLPWQKPEDVHYGKPEWDPRRFPSIVFPVVDAMGICENYVSGECSYETFETRKNPVRRLAETIAPTYTVNLSCMPGDSVYYCGQLYECVKPHPGGMWDRQHFKLTTVDEQLKKKTTPDEVSSMISTALSSTLVDYTTYDDVQNIVEGNLVNYATKDYADSTAVSAANAAVSGCITSSYVDTKLKSYVRSDVLSGQVIPEHPTHRDIATAVKAQTIALGGKVEGQQ